MEKGMEKRRFVRVRKDARVRYRLISEGKQRDDLEAKNISGGGLMLQLNEELPIRSKLMLQVTVPSSPVPLLTMGRVVWVKRGEERGIYNTGISFYKMRGAEQKEIIDYIGSGEEVGEGERIEKRRYVRLKEQCFIKFKVLPKRFLGKKEVALTKDISAAGILFSANRLIPIGTLLEVEIGIKGLSRSVKAAGRVVRVEEAVANKSYDIGFAFTRINDRDRNMIQDYVTSRM